MMFQQEVIYQMVCGKITFVSLYESEVVPRTLSFLLPLVCNLLQFFRSEYHVHNLNKVVLIFLNCNFSFKKAFTRIPKCVVIQVCCCSNHLPYVPSVDGSGQHSHLVIKITHRRERKESFSAAQARTHAHTSVLHLAPKQALPFNCQPRDSDINVLCDVLRHGCCYSQDFCTCFPITKPWGTAFHSNGLYWPQLSFMSGMPNCVSKTNIFENEWIFYTRKHIFEGKKFSCMASIVCFRQGALLFYGV